MGPITIHEAITSYAGFDPDGANADGMTQKEVEDYFTPANFDRMFGVGESDIDDWAWSYEDLAREALAMMSELRVPTTP